MSEVARTRLDDARQLLARGRCLAAVYLAGYTVEMRLKWAILQVRGDSDMPLQECKDYGHRLPRLFEASTVNKQLAKASRECIDARNRVKDWDHEMRYQTSKIASDDARDFVTAVEVLESWIPQLRF